MGRTLVDAFVGLSNDAISVTKRNKDKAIHEDLKESEFDEVVLRVISPESSLLRSAIIEHSQKLCEYTDYEITEFAKPVITDQLLRVSFWDEINSAIANDRFISERKIWVGVCSNSYWHKVRDQLSWKMAYVLCPLMSYSKANKLGLHLGQKAMIDILNVSAMEEVNGVMKFNAKIAQLQITAYNSIQDRMFGKAVQRLETHNTNENIEVTKESIEEIQKEIAQLELKSLPLTIETDGE